MYKSLYQEPINDELLALYNIKNYTNHKNTITVSITVSQIHSLRLRCDPLLLQAVQCFKLSLDCKTVCIFAYSSTHEHSNKRPGTRRGVALRLSRHNLPISFLILRKKKLTVSFRHANKTHFHKKVLKVSLLLCVRVFGLLVNRKNSLGLGCSQ